MSVILAHLVALAGLSAGATNVTIFDGKSTLKNDCTFIRVRLQHTIGEVNISCNLAPIDTGQPPDILFDVGGFEAEPDWSFYGVIAGVTVWSYKHCYMTDYFVGLPGAQHVTMECTIDP